MELLDAAHVKMDVLHVPQLLLQEQLQVQHAVLLLVKQDSLLILHQTNVILIALEEIISL